MTRGWLELTVFALALAAIAGPSCGSRAPAVGGGGVAIVFGGDDTGSLDGGLSDDGSATLLADTAADAVQLADAGLATGPDAAASGPDAPTTSADVAVADVAVADVAVADVVVVDVVVVDAVEGLADGGNKDGSASDAGPADVVGKDIKTIDTGPKPECVLDEDCAKGLCILNKCCPTKAQACGNVCCPGDQTCFAQACVKPGKLCTSQNDCGVGSYCELELGKDLKPPVGGIPGQVCLNATPKVGKCLKLPPKCAPGVPPPEDGSCLPECIWKPPAGKLDPVVEWQWGPVAGKYANQTDVWSTPTVGRVYDSNCDGKVNELDPPVVIFVSADTKATCCSCGAAVQACRNGVLRMLDGASGKELWSLAKPFAGSKGFAGMSTAIGDVNGDGHIDIVAMSGEGRVVVVDRMGKVMATSAQAVAGQSIGSFGWGGGLALADMEGDGNREIAYGATVFSFVAGKLVLKFSGKGGIGGASAGQALSVFADLDMKKDGHLELVTGNTAYRADGTTLWTASIADGFPAIGDFDLDGKPEVAVIKGGQLWLLEGKTGQVELGPLKLPGSGSGGPPTVADFDGDGKPEIGVAMQKFYVAARPDYAKGKLVLMWQTPNHDLSSSVTGSTVFDFEGDGAAEVIYNDECFLWVYDGKTGKVRFAALTTSFTATEAALVADVDGDGQAEMVLMSNGADPSANGWKCNVAPWNKADPANNRPAWKPPAGQKAYRGIRVFGSGSASWVGTRTLWSQHSYHVTHICDDRDSACLAPNIYGSVPKQEQPNWQLPWLNNFRQNVQDKGIFDAPDATVVLVVGCGEAVELHAMVRNMGLALLPAGVLVSFWFEHNGVVTKLAAKATTTALYPGQTTQVSYVTTKADGVAESDAFQARIEVDKAKPLFHECIDSNNTSPWTAAPCFKNPLRG